MKPQETLVRYPILILLFQLCFIGKAHAEALTFSYRSMVGASVRYEHPVGPGALFGEVGTSGWLIYGDDPSQGGNQSPLVLRNHLKFGFDQPTRTNGWYLGPRVVGAWHWVQDGAGNVGEVGLLGTIGQKTKTASGRPMQMGFGLGMHGLLRCDDQLWVLMPHVELRFGTKPKP